MPFAQLTVLVKRKREDSLSGQKKVGQYHHVITITIVMFLRTQTGKCNVRELTYWRELANEGKRTWSSPRLKQIRNVQKTAALTSLQRHHCSQSLAKLLLLKTHQSWVQSHWQNPGFLNLSLLGADSSACLDVSLTLVGFLVRTVYNTVISVAWKGSNKI